MEVVGGLLDRILKLVILASGGIRFFDICAGAGRAWAADGQMNCEVWVPSIKPMRQRNEPSLAEILKDPLLLQSLCVETVNWF